jgi:hypothetical protein
MPADASPDDVSERNGRVQCVLDYFTTAGGLTKLDCRVRSRRVAANHGKIRRTAYPSMYVPLLLNAVGLLIYRCSRHPAQGPAANQPVSISISFKPTTITTSTTIAVTSALGTTSSVPATAPPGSTSLPEPSAFPSYTQTSASVTESAPVTESSAPVTESSAPVTESPAQTVVLTVITTFVPVTITIPVQAPMYVLLFCLLPFRSLRTTVTHKTHSRHLSESAFRYGDSTKPY